MRGLKSTIALLAVLIGLGAYIYFVTWQQDSAAPSTENRVFPSLESGQIQEVTVTAESGDVTTIRKDGDNWQIVDPIQAPASASEAAALTSALASVDVVRVVDENPPDLAEYGLARPRVRIEFKAGDKPGGTLLLGEKTPAGGNIYAIKEGETRVFLVPEYQNTSLNKSTFDLRDKAVMKIERDKVDGVQVDLGATDFSFAKKGDEWRVAAPVAASADFMSVEALVGRVQTAEMKSIVTEQAAPADLRKYGLERPEASVTLNMGSATATLALGAKAGEDTVYARDVSKNTVVTVESSIADDVRKPLDDYRRKDAFDFRAYNATRAEFTRGGQTVAFERVPTKDAATPDSWKRVAPNEAEVDRTKMESLLAGLADIRATSFVPTTAKTGLDSPALVVTVKFEEGKKEERVTFGQSGADVYFSRPGEPGAAKTDPEKFTEALKTLDELSK